MKCFVRTLCLIAMLALMMPAIAHAQEKTVSTSDASTLQLKFFLAPVQTKPGAYTSKLRIVTPILIVPNTKYSPLVCHRMPRVIEALLSYFTQYPAPVNRKLRLDMDALEAQKSKMAAFANRALGHNVVSAVYILEGGQEMFPGATSIACGAVLEENDKKLKEAQKPK